MILTKGVILVLINLAFLAIYLIGSLVLSFRERLGLKELPTITEYGGAAALSLILPLIPPGFVAAALYPLPGTALRAEPLATISFLTEVTLFAGVLCAPPCLFLALLPATLALLRWRQTGWAAFAATGTAIGLIMLFILVWPENLRFDPPPNPRTLLVLLLFPLYGAAYALLFRALLRWRAPGAFA